MKSLKSLTLVAFLLVLPRGALANRVLSVTSNEEQITLTNEATKISRDDQVMQGSVVTPEV